MTDLQKRFADVAAGIKAGLVERDEEVVLLLTALAAGENCLLVGPPGAAKSLLVDGLLAALGGRKFSCLLTKFSTPDDLFGPADIPALLAGTSRRLTANRLAEAEWGFLDEVFRGNAAVLNALLKVMNERVYDRGDGVEVPVPLRLMVGAANTWPQPEDDLGAFFDRFLFRKAVGYVRTPAGQARLCWADDLTPRPPVLPPGAVEAARAEAAAVPVPAAVRGVFAEAVAKLRAAGVCPGDRRLRKAAGAARAAAWLAGRPEVTRADLLVLRHVLWEDPAEGPAKAADVLARLCDPLGHQLADLLLQADGVQAEIDAAGPPYDKTLRGPTTKMLDLLVQVENLPADPRAEAAAADLKQRLKAAKLKSVAAVAA